MPEEKPRTFYRKVNITLVVYLTLTAEHATDASIKASDLVHEHLRISLPDLPGVQDWEFTLSTGRAYPYFPEEER